MVDNNFIVIAITSPYSIPDEVVRISRILYSGQADIVHIRKPRWEEEEVRRLIEGIPEDLHPRLKLHDHFSLLQRFRLAGVHLNSRNSKPPEIAISVSRSLHEIEQLPHSRHYDYVTLSPIYDSISKEGYRSHFSMEELKPYLKEYRVVALGGVTPEKIPELKESGFIGAAMLGHFWNG